MLVLTITWSIIGALCAALGSALCLRGRRAAAELQQRVAALEAQASRAVAAAERGEAAALLPARRAGAAAATAVAALHRDSLRAPLLGAIHEGAEDGGPEAAADLQAPQAHDELPRCVQRFLNKAVRDGRRFKLFTLTQTGRVRLDARGGWKAVTAVQRACPLEPALVWSATASLAPLISLSGSDSLVDGRGQCGWYLWGALQAAAGSGREVDQSLLVRWLAEAACFPQALQPSAFLRWENVKGEEHEAEAVLTYGGACVRATFTFDRFARVARLRSRDFLRRLPSGAYEAGTLECRYSGHMLFGLSPQGPVMQAEVATHAGVFVPTNLEVAWVRPDGFRWVAAQLTVAKVTGAV